MNKPPYNKARETSDLSMSPPYVLEGVVMRVMPLKADIFVLGEFCNSYLNFDNEGQEDLFVPAFPIVFLAIVNYEKIAAQLGNEGWVAQNEMAFSVPLEWYKRKGDEWVFHDWATVSPFIFVDSPGSLTTGREVFGWPKILAHLTVGLDAWVKHPLANEKLISLNTRVVTEAFSGEKQADRVLLEVERVAPPQILDFPPGPKNPLNLFDGIARIVNGSLELGQTALDSVTRSPLRGFRDSGTRDFFSMLWQSLASADPVKPELYNNAINLKQFRDAQNPISAAYQAIVNSRLNFKRINGAGLLNEAELLRGDISAGFDVRIHRYDTQPIVESLGLEYAESHQFGKTNVYTLKPLVPFWLDVDMSCFAGQILRWRTRAVGWTGGEDEPVICEQMHTHRYNTTRGAAMEELTGPFWFPNATIRVLPLLADRDRLQELCDRYFGVRFWRIMPFGSYVYLLITNHEDVASESNNIGVGARRHVTISLPVLVYNEHLSLSRVMMFSPFRYTDSNEAAISGREINGWPTLYAEIESPGSNWLGESGPARGRQELVELRTDVLPAIGSGQEIKRKTLLQVFSGDFLAWNDFVRRRLCAVDWAPELLASLEKKQQERDRNSEIRELLEGDSRRTAVRDLDQRQGFRDAHRKEYRELRDLRGKAEELRRELQANPQNTKLCEEHERIQARASELFVKITRSLEQRHEMGKWRRPYLDDLKALSLEVLANRKSIREISLKQFRDAEDASRSCLQTIVMTGWRIERIFDLREMDDEVLHVAIHHWPSQPIVEQLGLKTKWLDTTGAVPVAYCEAIRPFWGKVSMTTDLGQDLAWRTTDGSSFRGAVKHTDGWFHAAYAADADGAEANESEESADGSAHASGAAGAVPGAAEMFGKIPPDAARELVELIETTEDPEEDKFFGNLARRQNLRLALMDWLRENRGTTLTKQEATDAIEAVGEPQAVLESILSREWENWGNPLWWQRQKQIAEAQEREKQRRGTDPRREIVEEKASNIQQKDEFFIRDDSLGSYFSDLFWPHYRLKKVDRSGYKYWKAREREAPDASVSRTGLQAAGWAFTVASVSAKSRPSARRPAARKRRAPRAAARKPAAPRVVARKPAADEAASKATVQDRTAKKRATAGKKAATAGKPAAKKRAKKKPVAKPKIRAKKRTAKKRVTRGKTRRRTPQRYSDK